MALFLIHEKPIIPLIQKLTESAIRLHERNSRRRHWEALTPCSDNDDDQDDDGRLFQNADDDDTMLLPPSFLNRLCEHDDTLWNLYCNWSPDLKFRQVVGNENGGRMVAYFMIDRLWKHHPEIIRAELMQLLHNYASQTTYVANADIDLYMIDSEVVAALAHEPPVSQVVFKIMAELLLEYGDWRIYRAWRHLVTATAYQVREGREELRIVYQDELDMFEVCTSWSGRNRQE